MLLKKTTKKKTYGIPSKLTSNLVSPKKSDKKLNYLNNNNIPSYLKKTIPFLKRKSKLSIIIRRKTYLFSRIKICF